MLEGGLNRIIPVNTPNPAAIGTATEAATPGINKSPDWAIEPMDTKRTAGNNMAAPVKKEHARDGLSEMEILKRERETLDKRIRELEMQLRPRAVTTTSA